MGKPKHRGAASEADVIAPLALLSAARAAARVAPATQGAEAYERRLLAARRWPLASTREATAEATATAAGAWAAETAAATAASQGTLRFDLSVVNTTGGTTAAACTDMGSIHDMESEGSAGMAPTTGRHDAYTAADVRRQTEVELEEAEDVAAAVDRADRDKWEWGSRVVWWESSYTWSEPELACGSWESEPEWHRNARSEEADARWNRDTVASWAASAKEHSTCPTSSYHSDNEANTVSD